MRETSIHATHADSMLLQAAFLIAAGFSHTALRRPCANPACQLPQPRAAVCAAADAENNDALPSMRETLPLVTPGPYLDSTLDTVLDTVLDAALDAWLDASWDVSRLKAKLQDQVAAGTEDAAPSLIRVCGGSGWVVHGLVLEYSNGLRTGFFVENDGSPLSLWDDAAMQQRGGVWHEVFPGEQLISISGCNSIVRPTSYLCGMVMLHLSSGRSIICMGANPGVFGTPFMHAAPGGGVLDMVLEPTFLIDGCCTGLQLLSRPQG